MPLSENVQGSYQPSARLRSRRPPSRPGHLEHSQKSCPWSPGQRFGVHLRDKQHRRETTTCDCFVCSWFHLLKTRRAETSPCSSNSFVIFTASGWNFKRYNRLFSCSKEFRRTSESAPFAVRSSRFPQLP